MISTLARQSIIVDGLDVRYWDAGDGPPLLLIHGLGVAAESWQAVLPDLASRYRVLVPDLPGFGQSALPQHRDFFDWDNLASMLVGFLHQVGVTGPLAVVGHSMGGRIAVCLALTYPALVEKLVLVNAAGLGRYVHPLGMLGSVRPFGEAMLLPAPLTLRLVSRILIARREYVSRDMLDAFSSYVSRPGARGALLSFLRLLMGAGGQRQPFATAELGRVSVPTLVVWSTRDPIFPVSHAHYALSAIPDCRAVVFRGVGHAPPLERPDAFNTVLVEFLESGRLSFENGASNGKPRLIHL